jgi:predicted DNA-binding transcriptional regulator
LASKDQAVGAAVLVLCVVVILIYGWLVFFPYSPGWDLDVLKLTGFLAIAGIFGIGAWIGWTMATTPPPKPIEELEKEMETEEAPEKGEKEEEKAEPVVSEQKEAEPPKKE